MVEIINKKGLVSCSRCKALLKYNENEDIQEPNIECGTFKGYIICPSCDGKVYFVNKDIRKDFIDVADDFLPKYL